VSAATCTGNPEDAGASVLRRLSALEYQLTLQDLFQLARPPSAEGIPADTSKDGFKTFAEVQSVSAQHLRAYLDKATELADALLADNARRGKVLGCEPEAAGCLKSFITTFGALAYRRSLEAAEIDSLTMRAESAAIDRTDQFRLAIQVILTTPSFLYRVEAGNPTEGLATLTGAELASRLSFGLWGRAPSTELLAQGSDGALSTPSGLARVADAMLKDPKAELYFSAFFRQWLSFDVLRPPTVPPMGWSDDLLVAMQTETDALLKEYAWSAKSFLDILNANHSFVSKELAAFHALSAPGANGLVEFASDHPRANTGVLTHPSVLSAKGDGDLIAIRGNWLRKTFLCRQMHIPPELQDQIGEALVGLTPVQIVQKRNTEDACRGCHALIDPIGVGFDRFDNLGRYDATVDITKYGVPPGLPDAPVPGFASIAELSSKLRGLPEVSQCLASKLFIYVNGREPAQEDRCALASTSEAFAAGAEQFPALVKGLVTAPAFRVRRAAAAP
jgi:hypothetical protein